MTFNPPQTSDQFLEIIRESQARIKQLEAELYALRNASAKEQLPEALAALVKELSDLIDDRETSVRGEIECPPKLEDSNLYRAVQTVEKHYPKSKLPMDGWTPWCQLLLRTDANGGELDGRQRAIAAYGFADAFLKWAKRELEHCLEKSVSAAPLQAIESANEKNRSKLFPGGVPDDTEIVDLAVLLDSAKGDGRKQLDIAREYTKETEGNDARAKRLLARVRMMKRRGKLNL